MSKKLKIGIIWANPYNANLGVAALAYSTLALIRNVIDQKGIEAEISFFGSSKNQKDSILINDKQLRFNNIYGMNLLEWKSFLKLFLFPRRFHALQIIGFDYVFDIAEGDSFTDIYGNERFNKILNSKRFFALLGKKQILLPQTIGPFKNSDHEKNAFDVMQKIETIISRDKQSYDYTTKFLAGEKISETIDIAFYLPFEKHIFDDSKINVGINISGLLWNGGYTQNNQFNLKTNYKELIIKTLNFFTAMKDVRVHLVGHVVSTKIDSVEDDYRVCKLLQKKYPDAILAPWFNSPIDAKSYISGLDFFTGARMHACIAAFSSDVPVYPMAYSRKFNGLFAETLQYQWMGDCVGDTEEVILNNLKESFAKRILLKDQICRTNETIVKPRLELLKSILSNSIK